MEESVLGSGESSYELLLFNIWTIIYFIYLFGFKT